MPYILMFVKIHGFQITSESEMHIQWEALIAFTKTSQYMLFYFN